MTGVGMTGVGMTGVGVTGVGVTGVGKRRVRAGPLLALAAALAGVPCEALAQSGAERVMLRGRVVESRTLRPIANALVELQQRRAVTDADGRFVITGVRPGRNTIGVSQLGYAAFERVVEVVDGVALQIELEPNPILLGALQANVDRLRARRNAVAASVRTLDRSALAHASGSPIDVLRGRVTLVPCNAAHSQVCAWRRGSAVAPTVYIDERWAFGLDELSAYQPGDFELIEVFAGGVMIRAYTTGFMERLAAGRVRLQPVLLF